MAKNRQHLPKKRTSASGIVSVNTASDGTVAISVDVSKVPKPSFPFEAEDVFCRLSDREGVFCFYQKSQLDRVLVTHLLTVRYSRQTFVERAKAPEITRFLEEVRPFVGKTRLPAELQTAFSELTRGVETKELRQSASMEYVARAGEDGEIRFVEVPASEAFRAAQRNDMTQMQVVPVVDVTLTLPTMVEWLDMWQHLAQVNS